MSISDHLSKGLSYLQDKNYQYAIYEYDKILNNPDNQNNLTALVGRSSSFLHLENYTRSLMDIKIIIDKVPNSIQGLYIQGQALFGLEDYNAALKAFQSLKPLLTSSSSNTIDKDNNISSIVTPTLIDVEQWIRKCTAELEGVITITETENNNNNNLPPFKPKFEWYQTNTHLTIAYLSKEINQASSSITIDEKSINVKLVGPISTSPFITCINLYESVQPDQAVTTYRATKVEIRIPKVPGANFMWPTLESTTSTISSNAIKAKLTGIATTPSSSSSTTTPVPVVASTGTSKPLPTPYASQKNWDALEKEVLKEEENEKPEGEEALQKLFRQIYKDGDEDTRRAMIKSFQTSGGTVLSTNWKDVAQHDYEKEGIKAPDGMEVRKWNTN